MPNRSDRHLLLVAIDASVAVLAFLAALRLRFGSGFVDVWEDTIGLPSVGGSALVLGFGMVVVFWVGGVYRTERFWSMRTEVGALLRASGAAALILMSLLYLVRLEDFSRATLAGFLTLTFIGTTGVRLLLRRRFASADRRTRVLFVGTEGVDAIVDRLSKRSDGPAEVVGYLGDESDQTSQLRLGGLMDLPEVLAREIVDEVIVCVPIEEWGYLDAIAGVCEEQGKVMRVPVDVVAYSLRRGHIEDIDAIPMLSLVSTPIGHLALLVKRGLDVVVSSVLLVLLMPGHVLLSAVLLVLQGRPVLFRQARSGLNGRPFVLLKYRTMSLDAETQKSDLMVHNERVGPAFKMTDDPRITPIGRWLRKTSVDELPQLWNVLVGHMSLVGPRPQPIDEVAAYDLWHRRRLTVRPGITGLWQVTSRDDPSFDRWVDLDLEYIDRWSVWLDLKILAMTPQSIIRTPGT